MRARSRNFITCTAATGLIVAAGFLLATARFAPATAAASAVDDTVAVEQDQGGVDAPVVGASLFTGDLGDAACVSKDNVVARLSDDESRYGGKVYVLADGLQQTFADLWRKQAHVGTVAVSSVVAHLFSDASGRDWTADVVEVDKSGCAISRTLMPGDVWATLLRGALGPEV